MDLFALPKEQYHRFMSVVRHLQQEEGLAHEGILFYSLEQHDNLYQKLIDEGGSLTPEELESLRTSYLGNEKLFLVNFNLFFQDYVRENEELRVYMEQKCASAYPWAKRFIEMKQVHIPADSSFEELRNKYAASLSVSI